MWTLRGLCLLVVVGRAAADFMASSYCRLADSVDSLSLVDEATILDGATFKFAIDDAGGGIQVYQVRQDGNTVAWFSTGSDSGGYAAHACLSGSMDGGMENGECIYGPKTGDQRYGSDAVFHVAFSTSLGEPAMSLYVDGALASHTPFNGAEYAAGSIVDMTRAHEVFAGGGVARLEVDAVHASYASCYCVLSAGSLEEERVLVDDGFLPSGAALRFTVTDDGTEGFAFNLRDQDENIVAWFTTTNGDSGYGAHLCVSHQVQTTMSAGKCAQVVVEDRHRLVPSAIVEVVFAAHDDEFAPIARVFVNGREAAAITAYTGASYDVYDLAQSHRLYVHSDATTLASRSQNVYEGACLDSSSMVEAPWEGCTRWVVDDGNVGWFTCDSASDVFSCAFAESRGVNCDGCTLCAAQTTPADCQDLIDDDFCGCCPALCNAGGDDGGGDGGDDQEPLGVPVSGSCTSNWWYASLASTCSYIETAIPWVSYGCGTCGGYYAAYYECVIRSYTGSDYDACEFDCGAAAQTVDDAAWAPTPYDDDDDGAMAPTPSDDVCYHTHEDPDGVKFTCDGAAALGQEYNCGALEAAGYDCGGCNCVWDATAGCEIWHEPTTATAGVFWTCDMASATESSATCAVLGLAGLDCSGCVCPYDDDPVWSECWYTHAGVEQTRQRAVAAGYVRVG